MTAFSAEELAFFDGRPGAVPLYAALRERMAAEIGEVRVDPRKTQISFYRKRMLGCVSLLPVRRAEQRPKDYITLTLGLDRPLESPRVDARVEARPHRWTHHILIAQASDLDDELMAWVREAAAFADRT